MVRLGKLKVQHILMFYATYVILHLSVTGFSTQKRVVEMGVGSEVVGIRFACARLPQIKCIRTNESNLKVHIWISFWVTCLVTH